jgi:peroxiredoxin
MNTEFNTAPELVTAIWLNTKQPISLEELKGKVVVIFAFQMLCPGCVNHSIPQAKKVHSIFNSDDVTVLGIHTVFEHHEAMQAVSLKAFIHEYGVHFPVAIDLPSLDESSPLPETMKAYKMGGTPTLVLIDKLGRLRKVKMGHEDDLVLGAEIMKLINEREH